MKSNPTKCHFICSENNTINFIVENQTIDNGTCEKLLGMNLFILTFNVYTDNIFKCVGDQYNLIIRSQIVNSNVKILAHGFETLKY